MIAVCKIDPQPRGVSGQYEIVDIGMIIPLPRLFPWAIGRTEDRLYTAQLFLPRIVVMSDIREH